MCPGEFDHFTEFRTEGPAGGEFDNVDGETAFAVDPNLRPFDACVVGTLGAVSVVGIGHFVARPGRLSLRAIPTRIAKRGQGSGGSDRVESTSRSYTAPGDTTLACRFICGRPSHQAVDGRPRPRSPPIPLRGCVRQVVQKGLAWCAVDHAASRSCSFRSSLSRSMFR